MPENLVPNLISATIFGVLGLVLTLFGYKLFDWITPVIRVEEELANKQNIAVAIVVGAVIVGVSLVVARAIGP
jgi:putative membrane protein